MAITASEITTSNTLEQLRTQFNSLVTDVTGLESGTLAHTEINTTTISVTTLNLNEDGTFVFEGATSDAFETTLTVVDPTADRTITLPNATGTVVLTSGVVTFTDTTEASATGTAALIVSGGLGVAKDMWIGDDIVMDSDSAVISFGDDQDVTLTHTDGTGLTLNSTSKLTFGDAASFVQQSSDGVLKIDGEATIDMNASTAVTVSNDLKLDSDAAVLGFGADNDVTLTHVADTGILLNSTMAIQFNDSSQYINAPSNAILDITATDEIELNATLADVNANLDVSGTGTFGGIIKTDDTTAATSTTDGSLQTDGGLSVAADAVIGDDLILLSDAAVLTMGADKDVTITHVADTGILLNSTMVIQFNDASQNIGAPSNAILDINATDEVEINATLIDVNGNLDVSGTGVIAGAITGAAITASGILKTDDTTAATSTTDGSLQTDGGLSVAADAVIGDDLFLLSDAAVQTFGADKDVTITHVADTGLLVNGAMVFQFRDSAINIGSPADGDLDINADDEIELNSTLIDVNGNLDVSGTGVIAGAITGAAITASGILKTDDTTAATSTTDGSLQTDGGLSVAADAVIGDDLLLLSDAAVLSFGTNSEVTLTHVHDAGLLLNGAMKLEFSDHSQYIYAPSATTLTIAATDEIELNATLVDVNANLDVSGTYTGGGLMTTGGNIVIPDGGNIGSVSDTDALAISSGGDLGIGIAPAARLHIKQAANSTNNGFRTERSDTTANGVIYIGGDDNLYIQNQANGGINFYTNTALAMTLNASGTLQTLGGIVIPDGGNVGSVTTPTAIDILGTGEIGCGNTAYTGGQFYIYDNTTGRVGLRVVLDNASTNLQAIYASTDGVNFCGYFTRSDTSTGNPTVYASNAAAGPAFQGASAGHTVYATTSSAPHAAVYGIASVTSHYGLIGYSTHGVYATSVYCVGAMYKGSGTFRIPHGLREGYDLCHSFIEGPQCDLIYRGKVDLVDGQASIDMDSHYDMTQGTFEWLTKADDVQTFTTNETGWDAVKSSFSGDTITIVCQNSSSTDTISWMVIAERGDPNIIESTITDDEGNLLIERESEPEVDRTVPPHEAS